MQDGLNCSKGQRQIGEAAAMMQVSNGKGLRKGDSRGSGRRNITQNELSEPGDRVL